MVVDCFPSSGGFILSGHMAVAKLAEPFCRACACVAAHLFVRSLRFAVFFFPIQLCQVESSWEADVF